MTPYFAPRSHQPVRCLDVSLTFRPTMFRIRRREGKQHDTEIPYTTYNESHQEKEDVSISERHQKRDYCKSGQRGLSRVEKRFLVLTFFAWLFYYVVFCKIDPTVVGAIEDINILQWRAMILMPISTVKIWFWEPIQVHSTQPTVFKNYSISRNNTFVVNLDVDNIRWNQFTALNGATVATRWSAVDMLPTLNVSGSMAQRCQQRYHIIQNLLRARRYGEAGVFCSHLSLYENFLSGNVTGERSSDEAILILEDDARFLQQPIPNYISAPFPADAIWLTSTVFRALHWSLPKHQLLRGDLSLSSSSDLTSKSMAHRVMGGFGTMGYLITRSGARRLLHYYLSQKDTCGYFDATFFYEPECHIDPIDIGIMKLSARHGFQLYLPRQWPLVEHRSLGSTKSRRDHHQVK